MHIKNIPELKSALNRCQRGGAPSTVAAYWAVNPWIMDSNLASGWIIRAYSPYGCFDHPSTHHYVTSEAKYYHQYCYQYMYFLKLNLVIRKEY